VGAWEQERDFRRKEGGNKQTSKVRPIGQGRETLMMRIELWDRRIQTCESLCSLSSIPDFLPPSSYAIPLA
jgi:hypothetical protein